MERRGFKILGEIDRWFLKVEFPVGWYKEPDARSRGWTLVFDDQDRLRCQCVEGNRDMDEVIANWLRHYEPDVEWDIHHPLRQRWRILDGSNIHFASPWSEGDAHSMAALSLANYRQAVLWLDQKYPSWRDFDAYW